MHATCLELCKDYIVKDPSREKRILDVGSGSGYLTAAFAALMDEAKIKGHVYGIELYPELAQQSIENIQNAAPELMQYIEISSGNVWENARGGDEGFDGML